MKFTLRIKVSISVLLFIAIGLNSCKTIKTPKGKDIVPEDYVEIAQRYAFQKSYKKAITVYTELIKKFDTAEYQAKYYDDIAWAHYEIGFCYLEMKHYDKAKTKFNLIQQRFSTIDAARILSLQRLKEIQQKQIKKEDLQK